MTHSWLSLSVSCVFVFMSSSQHLYMPTYTPCCAHILMHAQMKNVIAVSAGQSPSSGVEFLQRTPPLVPVGSIFLHPSFFPSFHSSFSSPLSLSLLHFTLLLLLPLLHGNKREHPHHRRHHQQQQSLSTSTESPHTHSALRLRTLPHALLPLSSSVKPVHFSALIPPFISFVFSFTFPLVAWLATSVNFPLCVSALLSYYS